jgi:hypothetical protein
MHRRLEDVLARDKFVGRITQAGSTIAEMISGYRALAQLERTTEIAPVSPDNRDRMRTGRGAGTRAGVARPRARRSR